MFNVSYCSKFEIKSHQIQIMWKNLPAFLFTSIIPIVIMALLLRFLRFILIGNSGIIKYTLGQDTSESDMRDYFAIYEKVNYALQISLLIWMAEKTNNS